MSRVMLVCPEPLGHGQPAGVGIRFLEIARVLRGDGHDVTTLAPDVVGITPESLLETSQRSDVAVVQGHVANAFFQHAAAIPTVIDLYDPFVIENLHYYADRGAEVFQHDHFTLMNSLVRGDFFLCASEAQRMFYLGVMLACGRLNPELFEHDPELESLIAIAPFGVPPSQLATRNPPSFDILFGGIYDWYDPITAIDAVALVPNATLTFTHHPNPDLTPQGKLAEAMEHVRKNGYDFVRFEPWAPYEQRAEFFGRFSMALLTFPRSLETDLSMRTRIYDYLWCGLPIVTSSAPGTDEILARYECGIVVADDAPRAFADAILRVDRVPMTRGAERFVRDHQWDRTLAPLRAFVRDPSSERTKESFAMRPSIPERPASILDRLKRRLKA
ncbi:MAG TPA: glycosyltransferase family 4 protein [Thermoanaerobaculia bacterium]|jgi:glycosyltransferase involved in cell wall biosynthesis|nr:glycosyltransferase family 4 protein [Thermoanaerobaculia bacterium]